MKEFRKKIEEILLSEWDPIGVRDEPNARDEYDRYVGVMTKMLIEKRSIEELADSLLQFEVRSMGLVGDRNRATSVAKKLVELSER